jgi:catechol 2,3-dioxygenase
VEDWTALRDAADVCAYRRPDETNPAAARPGLPVLLRPVGNRNEVFTGGFWVDPDNDGLDQRRWVEPCSGTTASTRSS